MQYNLCNEPWLKYAIGAVADRGLKANHWTSARLSSDVLFVETHRCAHEPDHCTHCFNDLCIQSQWQPVNVGYLAAADCDSLGFPTCY